jgi:hypothetical protein
MGSYAYCIMLHSGVAYLFVHDLAGAGLDQ